MSTAGGAERFAIHGIIGRGGFATVHLGTLTSGPGAPRTVAIKRLQEGLATNEQLIAGLIDEARLTSRIFHPNVVPTLEVVATKSELYVVMEYVEGEPLSKILGDLAIRRERVPVPIVAALMVGALRGLHAAHEASDERGSPLGIIHRDVSPQNIMVGTDGLAHLIDFGTAKAVGRVAQTREGQIKGKLSYMPPEQLHGEDLDRRVDVYAAGVVLWEALTNGRLFRGKTDLQTIAWIKEGRVVAPSTRVGGIAPELDAVVMRALQRERDARFPTAEAMADALAAATRVATTEEVAAWARTETADAVAERKLEVLAPPTSSPAPETARPAVRGPVRRKGIVAVAALLALCVLVSLAAFAVVRASRRDPGHHPAIPQITPRPSPSPG